MRRSQPYNIPAPQNGVKTSEVPELLGPTEMPFGQNLTIQEGQVRKRHGYVHLGTSTAVGTATLVSTNAPLDSDIMGLYQYRLYDGTEFLSAFTQTEARYYDNSNDYWTKFSGTATYTGDDEDFFYADEIRKSGEADPWLVFTNGADVMQMWTGTGTTTALTTNANLKAKYLVQFKNHLVLLSTIESAVDNPKRVRWSDTATPDDFDNGNASFLDLSGPSEITGGLRFQNDYLVVSRKDSMWLGYATGDSSVFAFEQKSKHGCPSGRTMVNVGQNILYMGYDDIYMFNGIESVSIGWPIRELFFTELDDDNIERCFAFDVPMKKEYWLVFPKSGGSGYPEYAWVYSYERNVWVSRHKFSHDLTCSGNYTNQVTLTIGDLEGNIGDQSVRIGDYQTGGDVKYEAVGATNSYIYSLTSSNNDATDLIDGEFQTQDFLIDAEATTVRVLRLDVFWEGSGLYVEYSTDRGRTWTYLDTFSSQSGIDRTTIFMRDYGELFRFKFKNATANQFFKFEKAVAYWQPSGDRT